MSLARKGELALVRDIKRRFTSRLPGGGTGIGDDAAVMPMKDANGKLLASVDAMVEGVHFDLAFITPRQLGYKLIAVNASDIYAMGGKLKYIFLSLALPSSTKPSFVDSLFDGIEDGLRYHKASLAGGDLSSSPSGISMSATVLGHVVDPIMRTGAKVGDYIYCTDTLGDSACGLELLKKINKPVNLDKGRQRPMSWDIMGRLIKRHLRPEPRPVSKSIASSSTAMMDLSDGLLIDLTRLCEASQVGAEVELASLPISDELMKASDNLKMDAKNFALKGGEDYVILFTSARDNVRGAYPLGRIIPKGYYIVSPDGYKKRFKPEGYGHFS